MTERCPHCLQPIKQTAALRVCSKCKQIIARHDKWHFVTDEKGATTIQHRHCDNPGDYMSKEERKRYDER